MIIDSHAHIYPDKISQAAVQSISEFYETEMSHDGRIETLIKSGDDAGVDKFLVHSVATTPAQVSRINDFIINSVADNADRFIGFMTLHPDMENIEEEVERGISAGLKGVKLHPDFQKFAIDDKKVYPLYEAVQGRLPILFHIGDYRYNFSKPKQLANVLDNFPKLQVIGAHFAGWSEWDDAEKYLKDYRLWVDSSSTSHWITREKFRKLIDTFGTDFVLFGSDFPMWSHREELDVVENIGLGDEQLEKILHKNIENLLGL